MLADGTYDALVVDAESRTDGRLACELTVLAGPHKGDVVSVVADLAHDPVDLLGLPATIVVVDGRPHVTLEP
jgi:hypothetical protein